MRTILAFSFALAFSGQAIGLAQDPYAAIDSMRTAFAQVRSATATERFSNGETATVAYNFPNRYHIRMASSEIVLTGDSEYARRNGGPWLPSSHGAVHQAMLQAVWQLGGAPGVDLHKTYAIASIGTRTLDGATLRGYRLRDSAGAYQETVWIGSDNLPVIARIAMPDEIIDIHFNAYNASTLVATPIQ